MENSTNVLTEFIQPIVIGYCLWVIVRSLRDLIFHVKNHGNNTFLKRLEKRDFKK